MIQISLGEDFPVPKDSGLPGEPEVTITMDAISARILAGIMSYEITIPDILYGADEPRRAKTQAVMMTLHAAYYGALHHKGRTA